MILCATNGRLGNQLFIYAFLRTLAKPGESVHCVGLDELSSAFPIRGIRCWNAQRLGRTRLNLLRQLLNLLSRLRLITRIEAGHEKINGMKRETTTLKIRRGLLGNIRYIKRGLFQSEAYFDPRVAQDLEPCEEFRARARHFVASAPPHAYRVFVHLRRGDYQNFRVNGQSALLPLSYYRQQIDYFRQHRDRVLFIFLSDSPDYIETHFSDIDNKVISTGNSFAVDFAIMTLCQGAILSASSYSWWGAYLMKERDLVFAPQYWLGFASGFECHQGALPSFASAVHVTMDTA